MKRRWLLIGTSVGLLILVIVGMWSGHILYADGPYKGKVIDKETRQPIEGAVVLAVWKKRSYGQAHPIITYYDAQETLTDSGGNFTIPGIWGGSINPLSRIEEPLFTIFKPGYKAYAKRRLALPGKEGRTVVELRGLTTREERSRNLSKVYVSICTPELPERLRVVSPYCVSREKIPNFVRLKNAEQRNLKLR